MKIKHIYYIETKLQVNKTKREGIEIFINT